MGEVCRSVIEGHDLDGSAELPFEKALDARSQVLEPPRGIGLEEDTDVDVTGRGCRVPCDAAEEVGGNEVGPDRLEHFRGTVHDLLAVHPLIVSRPRGLSGPS